MQLLLPGVKGSRPHEVKDYLHALTGATDIICAEDIAGKEIQPLYARQRLRRRPTQIEYADISRLYMEVADEMVCEIAAEMACAAEYEYLFACHVANLPDCSANQSMLSEYVVQVSAQVVAAQIGGYDLAIGIEQ